ncbi:MAG: apolipoprotein N-acyltransferase [Spirochaetes bacterium GWD1_27_9]|nr:MAG: apolipoprotein N-acyltransferase [Spirochaetes bacterium GWB1_27_13]OHD22017.1 MAG: apolipoprotein N-acyltransferase [Spirochaetes bacterium GWC1_27_15]OHD28650.1 MAG: apolipoprotein N-acyltransferase [Spirochaetes bacterium GWD1_27_9]
MINSIKEKIQETQFIYKVFIYILLGILWSFSNVGYSFGFLTWFTFVPFLFFIKNENPKNGFILGWIFGTSAYFFHFWWLINPFLSFLPGEFIPYSLGFLSVFIGGFITLLISIFHGLMYGLIFIIVKYISTKKYVEVFYISMPLVVTVIDYFFPKLFYDQIGYSQYLFLRISQIADVFGVPALTFLVISSNAAIVILLESILYKRNTQFGVTFAVFVLILILGSYYYGNERIKQIEKTITISKNSKIGIVQGNYSGIDKRDAQKYYEMLYTYNDLSNQILDRSPDLIVWPESSIPSFFDNDVKDFTVIKKFEKVPLLFGTHTVETQKDKEFVYNSLVFVSSSGIKLDQYNKMKLLPFVEAMPVNFLNFIMGIYGLSDFSKGKEYKIMESGDLKFSTNICYEDIIPEFVRKSVTINKKEANLIINCTNDSWFGKNIEPTMHLHIAGFRSIENRKSLVRSTCTGYSAVFDPTGNLKYMSKIDSKESTVVEVPLLEIKTVYRVWGWIFIYILGLFVIIFFGYAMFRKIKTYLTRSKMFAKEHYKKTLHKTWMD